MLKKSLSDLSTTILSTKDSVVGKNNELDSDQINISALITSYSMEEDNTKLFKKNYALFEIKLYTPYKNWTIYKRYSEFVGLKQKLEEIKVKNLPNLPPKFFFANEQKLNERQLSLEEFLNDLFKRVSILKYPLIIDFIECPQEVIDFFTYNINCLNLSNNNSSIIMNATNHSSNYYNGRITTNRNKSLNNLDDIDNNNFYCSMAQFKSELGNNDSFEDEISPGTLVIQEFLRNMMDISYNKTELLFQFEYFLKNKQNDNQNKASNWYYLDTKEINIFFNGFYSNISHLKVNGFLYHCGNIQNNEIGTQNCIQFLYKILSEDFNPQSELFLKIFRKCSLENIIQMELENHIINNFNSNRTNVFMILYKYVGSGRNIINKIKRILMCPKAEEFFMKWYDNNNLNYL